MTKKRWYGIFIGFLLVLSVFIAGCSTQQPAAVTTVPTTAPAAKYIAGDIVAKTSSSTDQSLYLILKYDSASDQYTRSWIYKNADGTWGHRIDTRTDTLDRVTLEKVYPAKVFHVDVSSIPIVALTIVTTVTTVSANSPSIANITPSSGGKDQTVSVTVTGSNFQSGATVRLLRGGSATIAGTAVSASASSISATFSLVGADDGSYNVEVRNPDGQTDVLPSGFTVGAAAPIITGVSPATLGWNQTQQLTITGQNFKDPALVTFTQGSVTIDQQYVTNVQVFDPTKIFATLFVPSSTSTGAWTVKVTNIADQQSGTWPQSFQITNSTTLI